MYHVYAIYNDDNDQIYVGQTINLQSRLAQHNAKAGNHYTARFTGAWRLIYSEPLTTRSEALKREKQLKSQRGREYVKNKLNIPA